MSDCLDQNLRNFSDETLNQPRSALKKIGGPTFQPVQPEARFPGYVMAGQTHPTLPPAMLRLALLPLSLCLMAMTVGI